MQSQFRLVVSLLSLKGNNNHVFLARKQQGGGNAVNAWFSITTLPKAKVHTQIEMGKDIIITYMAPTFCFTWFEKQGRFFTLYNISLSKWYVLMVVSCITEHTERGMIISQSHASTSGEQKKISHLQLVFFFPTEKIGSHWETFLCRFTSHFDAAVFEGGSL